MPSARVLEIADRVIAGWLADQAEVDSAIAQCGAVTLIQHFGSAHNLNLHSRVALRQAQDRLCRHLTRNGWLEGEDQFRLLSDSVDGDDGIAALRMRLITTYRIVAGHDVGRKVVTLQTLLGDAGSLEGDAGKVGASLCIRAWPPKQWIATS